MHLRPRQLCGGYDGPRSEPIHAGGCRQLLGSCQAQGQLRRGRGLAVAPAAPALRDQQTAALVPVRCGAVRCGAVRCGAVRCGAAVTLLSAAATARSCTLQGAAGCRPLAALWIDCCWPIFVAAGPIGAHCAALCGLPGPRGLHQCHGEVLARAGLWGRRGCGGLATPAPLPLPSSVRRVPIQSCVWQPMQRAPPPAPLRRAPHRCRLHRQLAPGRVVGPESEHSAFPPLCWCTAGGRLQRAPGGVGHSGAQHAGHASGGCPERQRLHSPALRGVGGLQARDPGGGCGGRGGYMWGVGGGRACGPGVFCGGRGGKGDVGGCQACGPGVLCVGERRGHGA
jgi:hypothetical protein